MIDSKTNNKNDKINIYKHNTNKYIIKTINTTG